jgi:hypothetical protein
MYLKEISLDFEEEKELERTLEIDAEMCVSLIDWQKAFDRVN